MHHRNLYLPFIFSILFVLSSCATFNGAHPQGFAHYEKENSSNLYKAVNPEGVTWKIRTESPDKPATLEFWSGAMRKRLQESGYLILDSLKFQCSGKPGFALESSAPLGQEDYNYLIGAVVTGNQLVIIEAAGPAKSYAPVRQNLIDALGKIEVR